MTPDERAARGARVKELLASDDVQAALAECEKDIVAEWRKAFTARGRERKWNELRGLERLKDRLATYAGRAPRF